jgi:hypothetical protein
MFKTEAIKGYNKLTGEDKKVFDKFLKDFYNAWEFPEEHEFTSVRIERGYANGQKLIEIMKEM